MTSTIHVVGAGLSGLAAAVRLVDTLPPEGARLVLHEAARQAGGRCRSYHDAQLGMRIDNGNHLVLSGNHTVRHFVERIGAGDKLSVPKQARFPFMDLASGERWEIAPNTGPLPWWIFAPSRRVPGTSAGDYLPLARLLKPKAEALLGPILGTSRVRTHLLDPLMIAALNTDPDEASAALAASVTRETLAKGAQACRPMVAREGLAAAFVDPALRFLEARGAEIRFGQRVRALETTGESVASLGFGEESLALGPSDHLVLAVPAWVAADLLPGLTVPDQHRAILNAHYLIPPPPGAPPAGPTTAWGARRSDSSAAHRGTQLCTTVTHATAWTVRPGILGESAAH